jgi:hypothetical protein
MSPSDHSTLPRARIRIGGLGSEGRNFEIDADAAERQAIAQALDVVDIDRLVARFDVVPFRGGFRVTGRVEADLHQRCVVTLVPVAEKIDEAVDRIFLPLGTAASDFGRQGTFLDPEADDEPDWFDGEWLELGPLIVETVSLALDPYPRAPGATLESAGDEVPEEDSPFAALRRLGQGREK